MNKQKFFIIIGTIIFLFGLYLAFIVHSPAWYSFFLIGVIILFEGLNCKLGFSFLANLKNFIIVWIFFIIGTLAVEWFGLRVYRLWYYPAFDQSWEYVLHVLILGYPLTAFFSLHFFYNLGRLWKRMSLIKAAAFPFLAFVFALINEFPNNFAHEWVYINWPLGTFLSIPILLLLLWIIYTVSIVYFFQGQFELNATEKFNKEGIDRTMNMQKSTT